MKKDVLYIVVPCYNEQEVLPATTGSIVELLKKLVATDMVAEESRLLYVNDGSTDATWQLIEQHTQAHHEVCGVKLAGNVGHQNALLAGMETACEKADIIVTVDADLQDDISVIGQMIEKYQQGCDIVYGVRRERKSDTWFKRNTALAFYKLMRGLGVKSVYNHADYRLMSRRAVKQLLCYRERNLFLRGIVPLVGYKSDTVYYDRNPRLAGESKYPLGKMLGFAVDGITSFSIKPVRMVFTLGILFTLIALGILIYVLVAYFSGRTVSGWSSLILSIWFVGGCVLVGLGIVGEYIGKIYIEVKDRPRYNIEQKILQ
ncbi:MAG: glycosyltransferase family 2 protein [Muribaculaceae bacterium]|nr:glycosyltransferase family 2 protein [Muribaculaceae bacterium]